MNIMVVDDETAIREGIKRTIESSFPNMMVFAAGSVEDALSILREYPTDLVLLDIMMPGMNGLELMGVMKEKYKSMKWIVISAHSEFSFAQEALRLGARDYILKPVGKNKLKEILAEVELEWNEQKRNMSEKDILQINLRYLREAVFRRWAKGLDIGRFDMVELARQYPDFYLIIDRKSVV